MIAVQQIEKQGGDNKLKSYWRLIKNTLKVFRILKWSSLFLKKFSEETDIVVVLPERGGILCRALNRPVGL